MNGRIVAEFVGGPLDGKITVFPELHNRLTIPEISMASIINYPSDAPGDIIRPDDLRYDLAYAYGLPSVDDRGLYRYELVL
jgi:hypothetical protein